MNTANTAPEPRKRALQQRGEETKDALLDAAIEVFSDLGYEGVSIRALETNAEVQRGAAAYHFGDKETLWKRAVDRLLGRFIRQLQPLEQVILDLDEDSRIRAVVTAFVRFSAESPQLNRLMVHEGPHDTWRLDYVIDSFVRERLNWLDEIIGLIKDPHLYYMVIGASTFVFEMKCECKELFGVDPTTDEFIREHAARVAEMVLASLALAKRQQIEGVT